MREETRSVVTTQGLLVLKLGKPLADYLGLFRWNNQRPTMATRLVFKQKTNMWADVRQYRHVEIYISSKAFQRYDPASCLASLVGVAFFLCQSWSTIMLNEIPLRTIHVDLGDLFARTVPFNVSPDNLSFKILM
jgi:hypothetical protein